MSSNIGVGNSVKKWWDFALKVFKRMGRYQWYVRLDHDTTDNNRRDSVSELCRYFDAGIFN
jgi:hypothetical protein